jgi:hypothetical protein
MELEEQANNQLEMESDEENGSNPKNVIDKAKKNIESNTQYKLARRVHMTKEEENDEMG